MIKRILWTSVAVFAAQAANGAGLDRSGQSTTPLFEDGRHLELSAGFVLPDVTGVDALSTQTGNVGENYGLMGVAYKADFSPTLSYALIFDQPYGANVSYGSTSTLYSGTTAEVKSSSVTGLVQYNTPGGFSVYGGVRAQQIGADVTLSGAAYGALSGYNYKADDKWGFGYVAGVAYERPAIALRVSLTYSSEIDYELDATESLFGDSTTDVTSPQSINLDFQTGIAADTLAFGSVRWVNWDGFSVAPTGLGGTPGNPTLVTYDNNGVSWNAGIGRRFTPEWSGALSIGYEKSQGGTVSALGPTDGYFNIGLGGTYTMPTGTELTAGVRYIMPGDAVVQSGGGTADFDDNSAIGIGLKLAIPL